MIVVPAVLAILDVLCADKLRQRSGPALAVLGGADDVGMLAREDGAALDSADRPDGLPHADRLAAGAARVEAGPIGRRGIERGELGLRAVRRRRGGEDRRQVRARRVGRCGGLCGVREGADQQQRDEYQERGSELHAGLL